MNSPYQVTDGSIKRGDIVLFRGEGPLFTILSFLIGLLDPGWRRLCLTYSDGSNGKPWHTAFIGNHGTLVEALAGGVISRTFVPKARPYVVYRWLDQEPTAKQVWDFLGHTLDCKYDVLFYPRTALAILIRHFWNRRIYKLLDNRFACWELAAEAVDFFGKPLGSIYDVPIITDILRALGVLPALKGETKKLSITREKS